MKMNLIIIFVGLLIVAIGVYRIISKPNEVQQEEEHAVVENVIVYSELKQEQSNEDIPVSHVEYVEATEPPRAKNAEGDSKQPNQFYIIPLDSISRFKHIPHRYLNHYKITMPMQQFAGHMSDWFFNDVFVKARNKNN